MKLQPGTEAPDFTAQVWNGDTVRLGDYRGRPVWLAFFRYASCPLCNLRVHDIVQRFAGLEKRGLVVLAVFQSKPSSVTEYVGRQEPPFPIICDPEESLYSLFGLESSLAAFANPANLWNFAKTAPKGLLKLGRMEGTKTRIPADFLIDGDGVLRTAFYGRKIADHIPFDLVDAFLVDHGASK